MRRFLFTIFILIIALFSIWEIKLYHDSIIVKQDNQLKKIESCYEFQKKVIDNWMKQKVQLNKSEDILIIIDKLLKENIAPIINSYEFHLIAITNLIENYESNLSSVEDKKSSKELKNSSIFKDNNITEKSNSLNKKEDIDNPLYTNDKRKIYIQDALTDKDRIRAILDSHIRKDSYNWRFESYKNNLTVDDNIQKFENDIIKVTGTFNNLTSHDITLTKIYTAELQNIKNDFKVISCKWISEENYHNNDNDNNNNNNDNDNDNDNNDNNNNNNNNDNNDDDDDDLSISKITNTFNNNNKQETNLNLFEKNEEQYTFSERALTNCNRIECILDSHIRRDSIRWLLGTYKNNLNVDNIQNLNNGRIRATGTFNTLTELGTTLTRYFTSELKFINEEYVILSCCWRTAFGTEWCIKVQ